MVASDMNGAYNIIHTGALGNNTGSAIDHRVENSPRLIVGRVVGNHDLPGEISTKLIEGSLISLKSHMHPPLGYLPGAMSHPDVYRVLKEALAIRLSKSEIYRRTGVFVAIGRRWVASLWCEVWCARH